MEQNVFYLEELNSARPPGNGNNCHGHNRSIQAGGNGHWVGDSCGCDGVFAPAANIDMGVGLLFLAALFLLGWFILKVKTK